MIYGSVCSGIEAATVAWHPLGWKPSFFSEIESFPRTVLGHHYPDVPLHGDFTTIRNGDYDAIQLLVGGTPCQAFSVAGLRKGLSDARGNLTLEFIRLAQRLRPQWLVWENVPGVLSIDGGRAFGSFLGGLGECGYGFAYRVLDAQYFGVPQRRRRVFVVASLGDWRPAAAVLFERESLFGDIAPCRGEGQEVAGTFKARANSGGWNQDVDLAAGGYMQPVGTLMARTCQSLDVQDATAGHLIAFHPTQDPISNENGISHALGCGSSGGQANVAIAIQGNMIGRGDSAGPQGCGYDDTGAAFTLTKTDVHAVATYEAVRRLTPKECERLQGFPDDYTLVPVGKRMAADGPRYKALGNSMAVPVMNWIGDRIEKVSNLMREAA
jgi:DNA (cytosine-5)-methyltransferase 1